MTTKFRQVLAVAAFSAVAAAALTGATLRGETKETAVTAACASAQWPLIPRECLEGGPDGAVRVVSAAGANGYLQIAGSAMTERFAVAFQ